MARNPRLAAIAIALRKAGKFGRRVVTPGKTGTVLARAESVSRVKARREMARWGTGEGPHQERMKRLTGYQRGLYAGQVGVVAAGGAAAAGIATKVQRHRKSKQPYVTEQGEVVTSPDWWKANAQAQGFPQGSRGRSRRGARVQRVRQGRLITVTPDRSR
jgi:hypothetical protein